IAHLQLGLFLQHAGAPFSEHAGERAAVYLTNALTGWEKPHDHAHRLPFPELEDERDAAEKVKRDLPILVILGNPPYNGYAGMAVAEERGLSDTYRTTKRAPAPQGQGLNDLYVRFFRMAERRIVEATGRGVVCFISNYSWLDGLSFTGMRERYLEVFDGIWIDCLNGDKYKTGKVTPDGDPDPSIFSTDRNREGIQVGTAIALFARKETHEPAPAVRFRHLWGKTKREQLIETARQDGSALYEEVTPPLELGLPFVPGESNVDYFTWPSLPELFPAFFPGVQTKRDEVVVDIDRNSLEARLALYFDPSVGHEEMARVSPRAMEETARFDAKRTREYLAGRGILRQSGVPQLIAHLVYTRTRNACIWRFGLV
ncbi:MAG: type ISP restriction/modification enzyme, partial [Thermoleophilia bacterium]